MAKADIQSTKLRFGIIGTNEALQRAIDIALQVATTDLSVLVTGESGVGKESFPQIIHQNSARKHGAYIAVNCGAIPEGTIDSELFGHEKGSFTGAIGDRNGYFAEANGGTIFLDEVGELPLSTQARLLRVLETGEYMKVGSSKVQKTDVRIIAATNIDFQEAIAAGKFREDLFYRLNTVPIAIPPLRERGTDVLLLFRKFAVDCSEKYRMPSIQLTEDGKQRLMSYSFPGNIRQLKNITEQISILETEREIDAAILDKYLPAENTSKLPALLGQRNANKTFESEREILYQVLFDLRRDVTELTQMVHGLMAERGTRASSVGRNETHEVNYISPSPYAQEPTMVVTPPSYAPKMPTPTVEEWHDADIEESLALNDLEKETIKRALEKHRGRRKNAAQDLNISERTLYRKLKEYGLE